MSEHLDRALEAIDVGLQRAARGHGGEPVRPDRCVRCQKMQPVADSSWCAFCDPSLERLHALIEAAQPVMEALGHAIAQVCVEAFRQLTALHEQLVAAGALEPPPASKPDPKRGRPARYTCPRHGPQPHGFCRTCERAR